MEKLLEICFEGKYKLYFCKLSPRDQSWFESKDNIQDNAKQYFFHLIVKQITVNWSNCAEQSLASIG